MVLLPYSRPELADEMRAFSATIEDAKARWLYCLGRVRRIDHRGGARRVWYSEKAAKVCERILGTEIFASPHRFQRLDELGYEGAVAHQQARSTRPAYTVGPLEAWHVGHVYFARLQRHPHIIKIGFSRRVHARLEDLSSQAKDTLVIRPGHLKVGTMADELWWHDDWRANRITGEWFFEPGSTDRTLPDFLKPQVAEAA